MNDLLDYLSTDELLNKLSSSKGDSSHKIDMQIPKKEKRVKIRRVFKVLYYIVISIAVFHVLYLLLQLTVNDRGMSLFGRATIVAVPIDQEIEIIDDQFEVSARVVVMRKFDSSELKNGDYVIIYGKFGSEYYWVERVVSFDLDKEEIITTVDGVFASEDVTSFDDVTGFYVRDAGLSGAFNYVSSSLRGFIITLLIYTLILYMLYYAYKVEEKGHQKKFNKKI